MVFESEDFRMRQGAFLAQRRFTFETIRVRGIVGETAEGRGKIRCGETIQRGRRTVRRVQRRKS